MKVLIAYRTRYGTTESCARSLAGQISGQVELHELRGHGRPQLDGVDVVLVGGSIYAGKIQREIEAFCEQEKERLLARRVGLFLCCFYTGERGMAELTAAFPPWLQAHAFARELLGGRLSLGRLSLPDRLLVRSLMHPVKDFAGIREDAIQRLAAAVNSLPRAPA